MSKQICLFLLLLLSAVLHGQDYYFSHFPFESDRRDVKGNVLYQDSDNIFWIGTDRGLLLFDGLDYIEKDISPVDLTEISISAIFMDAQQVLWLGTEDGRIFYGRPGNFMECGDSRGAPIQAMTSGAQGNVWAATYGKGLIAPCDTTPYTTQTGYLESDDLYTLVHDHQGRIWIGGDAGITILNDGNDARRPVMKHLGSSDGIRDEIIMSVIQTADGYIWAGAFERGFCAISPSGDITYPYPDWPYGAILSMASVGNSEIWISTEEHGIWRYDREGKHLSHVDIPGNATPVIADMKTDSEGNLWLLDVYRGLYRTNRRFESYKTNLEGIQSLLIDHTGSFYAGHPTGLYRIIPQDAKKAEVVLAGINVLSLYEDNKHNLWVGTFGQGLYCRPSGQREWYHYTKDNGLTDESILAIAGLDDVLWLATLGGVTHIQTNDPPHPYKLETTNYNLADGLGTNFIYTVHADSRGLVWFGTDGKGLSVLENGQIRNFQKADSIPLHIVYSITEAPNKNICFVTDRDGVFCYDGNTFTQIELPVELMDEEINNIVSDRYGNLLLAHDKGIDILTPDHAVVRFQESVAELLAPNLNAHFTDTAGTIWIAGQHRILRYNPIASAKRSYPHNVLMDVQVFLVPVDFEKEHVFSAKENYLTFDYIGLWYTNPRDVIYRYKMEGLDPDWNETRERSVTYQHIPPGTYRFVLESTCSGQYTSANAITYDFIIGKPFYQTILFMIGMVLLLFLLGYVILRVHARDVKKKASLQRRQIESQLQTLKAQINPHFLFNSFNTLVSVIEDDPRAAVEYVENLSDFYRSILQYREKNLIPLREEIEIVESFTYILRKRYGSGLHVHLDKKWPNVWVVPMVLQILVENAVKHNVISEKRPLEINIRMQDENTIIVENTLRKKNIGESSTGFGLQSIISRYALLSNKPVHVGQTHQFFYVTIPVLTENEIPDS